MRDPFLVATFYMLVVVPLAYLAGYLMGREGSNNA